MDARTRLHERLTAGPLLADGALGTLLFARGIPQRAVLDELVATRPELIGAIHREYLAAGADIIATATFGANRPRLAPFGLGDQAGRLARRGGQLAREARDVAGRDVLVAGSVGPLGPPTRDLLHLDEAAVRGALRETIDGLLEGGVDLFWFETFSLVDHLQIAVEEARRASKDVPIVALLTFGDDIALPDGTTPEAAVAALADADADVLGVNCGAGPVGCLEALAAMGAAPAGRAILPNAGLPQRIEGQFVYAAGPAYFGDMVGGMLAAGAAIVGGCCGTTPDHIAAMRTAIDVRAGSPVTAPSPTAARPTRAPIATRGDPGGAPGGDAPPPTGLARALAEKRFVISVEIDPPRSVRIERTIEAARLLQAAGVDAVNISDSAMARVRMGALAVAFGIQHDLDLECVVHVTTRDRNLMALESELLGAHALGVRDILALTGDPPRIGDLPGATGVWDVDSIGLVEILTRLNRGEDAAGSPIGQRAGFTIACALDPTAADAETEWDRLERKIAAGAQLVMTQPLYSVEQVEAMFSEANRRFGPGGIPLPLLLGVLPLQSSRHAEFLHNEVPGITIPDAARAALKDAGEHGAEVGLNMALDLLAAVDDRVAGTYVMPSFGRYEQAAELVRRLRARHAAARVPA
ncbi:MAG TPA: bifunctional homocysteine S-methyltransferase/methylenetetrahydrofolate reductase [Methylomirabilota bacterium]|nr:bifunctional homocysteine S-methyltransferase/methylenetetrahydrofolate reductase [Methylomirabilota bacterium]